MPTEFRCFYMDNRKDYLTNRNLQSNQCTFGNIIDMKIKHPEYFI